MDRAPGHRDHPSFSSSTGQLRGRSGVQSPDSLRCLADSCGVPGHGARAAAAAGAHSGVHWRPAAIRTAFCCAMACATYITFSMRTPPAQFVACPARLRLWQAVASLPACSPQWRCSTARMPNSFSIEEYDWCLRMTPWGPAASPTRASAGPVAALTARVFTVDVVPQACRFRPALCCN